MGDTNGYGGTVGMGGDDMVGTHDGEGGDDIGRIEAAFAWRRLRVLKAAPYTTTREAENIKERTPQIYCEQFIIPERG